MPLAHASGKRTRDVRLRFEDLLKTGHNDPERVPTHFETLRKLVLMEGLPSETEEEEGPEGQYSCGLRGRVWKVLLRIREINATEYIALVERGRSGFYDKIRNDTFRTFPKDQSFKTRVPENKLIRVLNAFVHADASATYVQGMNALAAPFLYCMPEVDAFYSFKCFLTRHCPLYVTENLSGAHVGAKLLDKTLEVVDPELLTCLHQKDLSAKIYCFPSILSLSACTPPLSELLRLWDFFMAFGVHMNIVCLAAQIVMIRNDLLKAPSPMKYLRTLPDLDSQAIIALAVQFVRELPETLHDHLVRHPYDPTILSLYASGDEPSSSSSLSL